MNGAIAWEGLSLLDGVTPIVLVLTGLEKSSKNAKTGDMVQAWIIVQGSMPSAAIKSGADAGICGDCKLRGSDDAPRRCYVRLDAGLGAVAKQVLLGKYPRLAPSEIAPLLRARQLRCGAYGDPAAVPPEVWEALLEHVEGWTGYTHQWRTFPKLASFLMASVDSEAEYHEAKGLGWRTFRVRAVGPSQIDALLPREIVCPASVEAGHKVGCAECGLCKGNARPAKDIAIVDHSTTGRAALKRRALPVLQGSLAL